jgi:hypothetical protein
VQPQNAMIVAAVDPGSSMGPGPQFSPEITQQASRAGVQFVADDFWRRLVLSGGMWAAAGAAAGWYWWQKPLHGAAVGAAFGTWSNLSYQTGRVVGYSVAEAKRLEDVERHQSALGQFLETSGKGSRRVPATAGLRSRIAGARRR